MQCMYSVFSIQSTFWCLVTWSSNKDSVPSEYLLFLLNFMFSLFLWVFCWSFDVAMGPNEQLRLCEVDQGNLTYAVCRILYGWPSEDEITNQSKSLYFQSVKSTTGSYEEPPAPNDKLNPPSSSTCIIISFCFKWGDAHNLSNLFEMDPMLPKVPGKSILLCLEWSLLPHKGPASLYVQQIICTSNVFTCAQIPHPILGHQRPMRTEAQFLNTFIFHDHYKLQLHIFVLQILLPKLASREVGNSMSDPSLTVSASHPLYWLTDAIA